MSNMAAITGVGAVGPGFADVSQMLKLLFSGSTDSCRSIKRFDTIRFQSQLAFQIESEHVHGDSSEWLIVRMGRQVMGEALQMAGLDSLVSIPVIFATANAGVWEMEAAFGSLQSFVDYPTDVTGEGCSIHFGEPADRIVREWGTTARPTVVSSGCTAGLDAIGLGWWDVLCGADVVAVIAAEAPITPMVVSAFDQAAALTDETSLPRHASIPFDRNRSGFCLAEGSAALILEPKAHVMRRRGRALGWVRGYSVASSAFHMTAIREYGRAIGRVVEQAMAVGGVGPSDVGLIAPHATSTVQNDRAEYNAFRSVFGDLDKIPLFCPKAHMGHSLGASGALETIATPGLLNKGWAPAYPHLDERSIEFDGLHLPPMSCRLGSNLAVKNSSGFSGIHSAIVLEGASC